LLQALAGHDPADPSSAEEPVPDYRAAIADGVRGLRIGLPERFFFEGADAQVEAAVREAVRVLEGEGASVTTVPAPLADEISAAVAAIMLPEALAYHQRWMAERPDDYHDDVRYRLELGATYLAVHYVQAQRLRELAVRAWRDEVFSRVDIIATPATLTAAAKLDRSDLQTTFGLIRLTNPLNFLGIPAISLPCGFTSDGLPIGLQLAGRWWDEATVLRAAHAYERATEWHLRRPPA
jgi:aspartyl-tRNA(Asn)/glutamyl-tRNA(Gln) amidotransferase subunit A